MQITVDLHSHSGASGGVGDINFDDIYKAMRLKGIDVYGTGDCLFPKWLEYLKNRFTLNNGLLSAPEYSQKYFLLQTELIFTIPYQQPEDSSLFGTIDTGKRKSWHNVVLFPSFAACEETAKLLKKYQVKNTIGRPFVKAESLEQLEKFLFELQSIDPDIEVIPAHIFTPDGAFGSNNPINNLKDLYGSFLPCINAVETGLSANPQALMMIPQLDNLSFVSFSDAHSGALNRLGREYTKLEIEEGAEKEISCKKIIQAIRNHKVKKTCEFNMAEGRYFLTGHRQKPNHTQPFYCAPDKTPSGYKCPICGKRLTIGVLDRVYHVSQAQNEKERVWGQSYGITRSWQTLVPLIEVIAASTGLASLPGKKINQIYRQAVSNFDGETALWETESEEIANRLENSQVNKKIINDIIAVREGLFKFDPPGFDGCYGKLVIGCR
ncbi:hypothetical protein COT52_01520 [candidate division WWE3 bacterium CG08_land_8_20_14_0_20_43_13]|uniref:DNA helicase UvrD n=1 Tax=candidate division WWE3 bacterium CG08_land_8_20_14_0_20_43_13 TaxID=1975087 RepID=A0A2H0X7H8_UNCKA|nr:MAG: hypothetical protein COT52_01520 [candidate division WWE3 bacterium CG08_land_8_20_14_0_20_43_13]